jgi:hypothetical protein
MNCPTGYRAHLLERGVSKCLNLDGEVVQGDVRQLVHRARLRQPM